MTQEAAKKQIETIERITAEALKSKESAKKILMDAGIVKDKNQEKRESFKKK